MAPIKTNGRNAGGTEATSNKLDIDTVQLEKLLIRDADVFQTSLDSEDYLDSLAPLIKDALKGNALAEFIGKLNDIVKDKDNQLNEMSLESAHDINKSIDSIDHVSQQSAELSGLLQQVNGFLNKSVFELVSRKNTLIRAKDTSARVNETITVLNLCIQVLETANRVLDLIKQQKSFSALKLMDELTSIHLPKVRDFSFSVKIYDSIPHITSMIKDEAFDSLCKWLLTHVERKTDIIGEAIFANWASLHDHWEALRENTDPAGAPLLPHRVNSPVELSMRDPHLHLDIFASPHLAIPLKPVFDCVLVYQSLSDMPALAAIYHKQWMAKYPRVIYPITLSSTSNDRSPHAHEPVASFQDLSSLEAYLKRVAAFFVADKQLNTRTRFELRTNAAADDLWDSFVLKLKPVLLSFLLRRKWGLDDLALLSDFKDLVGTFLQVMENSLYKITDLYDIMLIIFRDYFGPVLIQSFRLEFLDSIQSDHYMPLVVTDKTDYDNVMKICWYKPDASFAPRNLPAMPISFPFSEDYVHYCLGVRTLMQDILDFIYRHYNYNLNELNRIIVDDIFEKVLGDEPGVGICSDVRDFISRNASNKEIVSQSYANLEYYLYSLYEIGKLLDRRLRRFNGIGIANIDTNSVFKLRAIELFSNVRKFSEDAIFNMVDQKLTELLDMVVYDDWYPSTPNKDPNFFILDFSMFLENLFNSIFSNLPTSFKTLGLFRSYDFVSEHFLNILVHASGFNRVAIQNFDLDVRHLEQSMEKLASDGKTDGTGEQQGGSVALQSTFAELRQTIDMLLLEDHDEFLKNSTFRMRRFDRLRYDSAVALIKKLQVDSVSVDEDHSFDDSANTSANTLDREASVFGGQAAKFAKWRSQRRINRET